MPIAKDAVVLAAGVGSRIKHRTKNIPKGMLKISGKSLMERSVEKLFKAGIQHVYIGTGYGAEHYEELLNHRHYKGRITLEHNENYLFTGSMFTLHLMEKYIISDFLLLESDLLYDPKALTVLNLSSSDSILGSDISGSGDEVYIIADEENRCLKGLDKEPSAEDSKHIAGEFTGISRLSKETLNDMCTYMKNMCDVKMEYEQALSYVAKNISKKAPVRIQMVNELTWCEIDTESDYQKAIRKVHPRLEFLNREI